MKRAFTRAEIYQFRNMSNHHYKIESDTRNHRLGDKPHDSVGAASPDQ